MRSPFFGALAVVFLGSCKPSCAGDACGCWEPITIDFQATVVDAESGDAIFGIEAYCPGESLAIAVSDAFGKLAFEIETEWSESCLYYRCTQLRLEDPAGTYPQTEGFIDVWDGTTVELTAD